MKDEGKLTFRPIGRGFIIFMPYPDGPVGRSLTMAYRDQYDNTYVDVNGVMEPLQEKHRFLAVD